MLQVFLKPNQPHTTLSISHVFPSPGVWMPRSRFISLSLRIEASGLHCLLWIDIASGSGP